MLKKLLTGCLTIAMAAAMALPAMAEVKVGGHAFFELVQSSSAEMDASGDLADAESFMDMNTRGQIQITGTASAGDWTATGFAGLRSNWDDTFLAVEKYVKVENDAFSIGFGRQWWGFCYQTAFMGNTIDRPCYGGGYAGYWGGGAAAYAPGLRADRLIFTLKDVGLQIMYGAENESDYQETTIGLQYNGNFDALSVVAAYLSNGRAGVEAAGTTDGADDGASFTSMAFSVKYAISEAMMVEFDYESETDQGNADLDENAAAATMMGLAFTMMLSESSGFTAAYDMITYLDEDDGNGTMETANAGTLITLNYNQSLGGATLMAGYNSYTLTNADLDDSLAVSSNIVFGMKMGF